MNFEKKKSIVVSPEDITHFRSLLDQLNVSRHKCQEVMVPLLNRHGLDVESVGFLEFSELTSSLVKRNSKAGVMKDDLQRFRVFNAAVKLISETAHEGAQELSEQMSSLITDITSLAFAVLRRNAVSPPDPPVVEDLEETLDETTREFLEFIGEETKMEYAEMTWTAEIIMTEEDFIDGDREPSERAVYDVRNYVIVRDLRDMMTRFQRDLGHLIPRSLL